MLISLAYLLLSVLAVAPDYQYEALKELYKATNGGKWRESTNWPTKWVVPDHSYCGDKKGHKTWFGINCEYDTSFITAITLNDNALDGSLPEIFSYLPQLTEISVSKNSLQGPIPSSLSNLTNLKTLDVSNNQFKGRVPPEIWLLTPFLSDVDMSFNQLSGPISDISGADNIATLNLAYNKFSGTLPASYGASLAMFNVSHNALSGPVQLGFMVSQVDMSYNVLTGPVPVLSNLFSIDYLDLSFNRLNGTIPDLYTNPSLETLALAGNQLTGALQPLDGLSLLTTLDVSQNQLSGALPSLGPLSAVTYVNLSHNAFTGAFPQLSDRKGVFLSAVLALDLSYNNMTGQISNTLARMASLETLILSHNNFSGQLPDLANLTNLMDFEVEDNDLTGKLPNWAACRKIMKCDASGNDLSCQTDCTGNPCNVAACSPCGNKCTTSQDCASQYDDCAYCDPGSRTCMQPSRSASPSPTHSHSATASLSYGASPSASSGAVAPFGTQTPAPQSEPMWVYLAVGGGALLCVIITVVVVTWRVRVFVERRNERRSPSVAGYSRVRNEPSRDDDGPREVTRKFTVQGLDAPLGSTGSREQAFTFVIDTKLEIIKWADLELLGPIGKGGYGTVMRARRGHTLVAVKLFPSVKSPQQVQEFVEEASVLSDLKHPNCVLFMGVTIEPNHMSIVTEYMKGGDLHSLIYPDEGLLTAGAPVTIPSMVVMSWDRRLQIVYDTAVGLEYLHRRGIAHRDIKLRNILLDDRSPQTVKLCDFGLSGLKKTEPAAAGTERYAAPEIMAGGAGDTASDMYALAIVACEVLFGRMPDVNAADPVPEGPAELRELLKACLRKRAVERPSISRFLSHLEAIIRENHPFININASFGQLPFDSPSRNNLLPQFASPRDPLAARGLAIPSPRDVVPDDSVTRTMTLGTTPGKRPA